MLLGTPTSTKHPLLPLISTREQSVDVSLNLAYKQLRDNQSAVGSTNPRGDEVATLGIQKGAYGSLLGQDLFTMMSGSVDYGTLTIQDPGQRLLNQAGANTGGTFAKANVSLLGNLTLNDKFSLKGSIRGQKDMTGNNPT